MNMNKVKIMVPKFEKIEKWYHKTPKIVLWSLKKHFCDVIIQKIPIPRRNRDISIALCISQ